MRILYCSQYYPPEMGAPAARVSQLARAWAADGHDVTVLTGFPNHPTGVIPPEYRGRPYIRHEHDHGVHVVRAPIYAAPNKGVFKRSLSYASYGVSSALLGPTLTRPDIVIGTSPQFLTAVSGYAIAKAHRVPFVFEVRDLWPRSIVEVGAMSANSPVVKAMERAEMFLYEHSDRIVVVTDSFVDEIAQRGISREKLSVVKNGVDLDLFMPGPKTNDVRQRLGLEGKFVATYIGTHGMAHGLGTLLDAAALLKNDDRFRFVLVGEGADKAALMARAEKERLSNILFIGQQPHREIPAFVRAADVTIVLLKAKELFKTVIPSKIFEYMGAARPIVLGVDGEARRIVEDAGAGVFVPPESAEQLVAQLRRFAAEPARGESMGEKGRTFVEAHFSRAALARRYLSVLSDVIHGKPERSVAAPAVAVSKEQAA